MNTTKWDAIAEAFAGGTGVPANGWEAWNDQARREAITIRGALPHSVDNLLEVGCGIGRLTPHLALMFLSVTSIDTSTACRMVTRKRCRHRSNVTILPADARMTVAGIDAALVWALYDEDWPQDQVTAHRAEVLEKYGLVLEGNAEAHWLHER